MSLLSALAAALVHGSGFDYLMRTEIPEPEPLPMKYPKRSQYKYAKSQYRVRNWSEYEAGLKKRGDLTVWIAGDALDAWREAPSG